MKLSNLFNDDKAVSPVIGVILMVAITVILAAVIGTFVLGLGDSISDTTPSASISGEIDTDGNATFTHQSGQNIDVDNLRISDTGGTFEEDSLFVTGEDDRFSSGDRATVENSVENSTAVSEDGSETVRLVFDSGSTSSTLASIDYDIENEE